MDNPRPEKVAVVDEVRDYHDLYRDTIANRTGERLVSSVVNDHFTALLPTIVLDDGEEVQTGPDEVLDVRA